MVQEKYPVHIMAKIKRIINYFILFHPVNPVKNILFLERHKFK